MHQVNDRIAKITPVNMLYFFQNTLCLFIVASSLVLQASAKDFTQLRTQAEKGDLKAQLQYAKALDREYRWDEARIWFKKAADQGSAEGMYRLGYVGGYGDNDATYYYEKAANLGNSCAITELLRFYLFRAAEGSNIAKAKEFADIARKFRVDHNVYGIDVVDICFDARNIKVTFNDNGFHPYSVCSDHKHDDAQYGECVLKEGNVIDLATIYANGTGVPQDFNKAIAYACYSGHIPAEIVQMVTELDQARKAGVLERKFSYCDHATGNSSMSNCYRLRQADKFAQHDDFLASYRDSLTPALRELFVQLEEQAAIYFDARANHEQDLTGSMRGIFITEVLYEQKNAFVQKIKQYEKGAFPKVTASSKTLNAKLNATFAQTIANLEKEEKARECGLYSNCDLYVNAAGLQISQNAWRHYRDAWAKFAAARFANTTEEYWHSAFTAERLKEF